jgi:hypothetical protein
MFVEEVFFDESKVPLADPGNVASNLILLPRSGEKRKIRNTIIAKTSVPAKMKSLVFFFMPFML